MYTKRIGRNGKLGLIIFYRGCVCPNMIFVLAEGLDFCEYGKMLMENMIPTGKLSFTRTTLVGCMLGVELTSDGTVLTDGTCNLG